MDEILEEVEAIAAIYCGKDEFFLQSHGISSVTFGVTTSPANDPDLKLTISFTLSCPFYPNDPPSLSIQSHHISRQECDIIKAFLLEEAKALSGTPMVLSLLTAIQEKEDICKKESIQDKTDSQDEDIVTSILQLDHMRNKTPYTKTITRWCEELDIHGRLLFCNRWIFIILQGTGENIKTYIQRNKHRCVDVDSSGHPCKERMLSTLYHGCQEKLVFSSFEVVNVDQSDLKNYLTQYNLCNVYLNYIFPLINKK